MKKNSKGSSERSNNFLHIALFLFLSFAIGFCCYEVYDFVVSIMPIFHSTQW